MQLGGHLDILGKGIGQQVLVFLLERLAPHGIAGSSEIARLLDRDLPPDGVAVTGSRLIGKGILHGWDKAVAHTDIQSRIFPHDGIKLGIAADKFVIGQREGYELMARRGILVPRIYRPDTHGEKVEVLGTVHPVGTDRKRRGGGKTEGAPVDTRKDYMGEINGELLLSDGSAVTVSMPSAECILGDKLTAFAPHTTGVPFGIDKELEIIKQLFDVAALSEKISNWEAVVKTYDKTVLNEIGYRNIAINREDSLLDTIQSCACIVGKGVYDKEDFQLFLKGIRSVGGHVLSMNYNLSTATEQACRVMHLASCLLTKRIYAPIQSPERYLAENISMSRYKKLSYMRSQNANAFAHLVEALRNLGEI